MWAELPDDCRRGKMKKRVLVVDDEPKLCSILERVLVDRGYEIRIATDGRKALEVIPEFDPHLVIADVALPEMDGLELCRRIRSDERFRATRFIFLTSKAAREDEIEGLAVGADDYITKPLDVEKLMARVDARLRWLDAKPPPACDGSMEGNLDGRNLIDVLQILELGQRTGKLEISEGDRKALISLSLGKIASAVCGSDTGKDAVLAALAWARGRFRFTPLKKAKGSEKIEITPLLLEWARDSDEEARRKLISSDNILSEFIQYVKGREKK
jgi:DNA-binding response OmpR family regulator